MPTGFRKGPINFSRVKFHSKRAEIMYFGVSGWELADDAKHEPDQAEQSHVLASDSCSTTVLVAGEPVQSDRQDLDFEKVCIGPTQATSEIEKILQKENVRQYQPIFKLERSFKLPEAAGDLTLAVAPKQLAEHGLEMSSMAL